MEQICPDIQALCLTLDVIADMLMGLYTGNDQGGRREMAVLTLSRQFGAGGKTLAERVAERLGYTIATEAIVEHLAESAKVSPEGLPNFEAERDATAKPGTGPLSPGRFIDRILDPHRKFMDGKLYVKLLGEIIPKLAENGNTIIVGRGAQFILKGAPNTHHVLLVAEEEDRIRFMIDHYDLAMPEARSIVQHQEKRRSGLMKLFHHEDYDQPWHYDLVLNTSKLSMDQAVDLVCALVVPPVVE
jgi:cytidylate kinase